MLTPDRKMLGFVPHPNLRSTCCRVITTEGLFLARNAAWPVRRWSTAGTAVTGGIDGH